ncbi:MAG: hypothetical protein RL748_1370 [Pseudomonadota bacterium]
MEWFVANANQIIAVLSAFAAVLAPFLAIFVFQQFSPVAQIRILTRWIDQENGKLVLRIEIENKSKVRIRQKVAMLQVLRYSLTDRRHLSEWVPFSQERVIEGEEPLEWNEPKKIFASTVHLYPGEVVVIERLEQIENPDHFLHVGIQYKSHFKFRWLVTFALAWEESWTTTAIIARPEKKPS